MNNYTPTEIDFDTKILRYIIAIVDERSLSKAAESLYLSQPALSRYLKKVEQSLGSPIFYRKHNELSLTNSGKIFINGARRMIQIEDNALKLIHNKKQAHKSVLQVAVQDIFSNFNDAYITPEFYASFPEFSLDITYANEQHIRKCVNDGTVDLGLFIGQNEDTPFFSQTSLYESELIFFAAPNAQGLQLCQDNDKFDLSYFAADTMCLSPRGSILAKMQERILIEHGISDPDICVRGRLPVIGTLLNNGYGNVIIPIEAAPDQNSLLFHFSPVQNYHCLAAWYKGRPISEPAKKYIQIAQKQFKLYNTFSIK